MNSKRETYITTGVKIAESGLEKLTFQEIARLHTTSAPRVYYHFPGGKSDLRTCVINRAIQAGNSRIIVQLIAMGDPTVSQMSIGAKYRYVDTILRGPLQV